jgi:hypothetical protein
MVRTPTYRGEVKVQGGVSQVFMVARFGRLLREREMVSTGEGEGE